MKQVIGLVLLALLCCNGLAKSRTSSDGSRGSPSGRIVNGTAVSIEDYPFIVRIHFQGFFICGASIITSQHALSAAHCFVYKSDPSPRAEELTVVGGSTYLSSGVVFSVKEYRVHPDFNYETANADAAIVTIVDTFVGYPNIAAIPLQTRDITYSPENRTWCFIAGWGLTAGGTRKPSDNLQLVWMQVISQYSCAKQWDGFSISSRMICTELPRTDACRGDSGGPLVCNGQLTGIVSGGDFYCAGRLPSVFAKVTSTSIRTFIRETAGI
uniref:Peptidase S1 domain-containing protein n=1 Tax=Anopheles atroparvus TaxID=41427 RepID=A0AAG5DSA5_ANOAO